MEEPFDGLVPTQRPWALGDQCEYLSLTCKGWIRCRIIDYRAADGAVQIDAKRGLWLKKNVQEAQLRPRGDALSARALSDLQAAIRNSTLFGHLAPEAHDRAKSVLDGRTTGIEFARWWAGAVSEIRGQVAPQEADAAVIDVKQSADGITTALKAVMALGSAAGADAN